MLLHLKGSSLWYGGGTSLSFKLTETGTYEVEWYGYDGLWNCENPRSQIFYVETPPVLDIEPTTLNFNLDPGTSSTKTLNVKNIGGFILTWSTLGWIGVDWIDSVDPWHGSNYAGESTTVSVTVTAPNMPGKDYSKDITVKSNDGTETVSINLHVIEPEDPELYVHPTHHDFGIMDIPEQDSWTFHIENTGEGTLSWSIAESKDWIEVDPSSGTTTTETDDVTVTVDTNGLDYDRHYEALLQVTSNGGFDEVEIELDTGESPPELDVSPESLSFKLETGGSDTKIFKVKNIGGKTLDWNVEGGDDVEWITSVAPSSWHNSADESITVSISVSASDTPARDYDATLYVFSNGGNEEVSVHLRVMGPELCVSPTSLSFRLDPLASATKTFTIKNAGDGSKNLDWSLGGFEEAGWVDSVGPTSGSNSAGKSTTVSISMTAPDTEGKNYNVNIDVSSNAGDKTVSVHLHVNGPSLMHVVPNHLNFDLDPFETDTKQIRIKNLGEQTLEWHIGLDIGWVTRITPDDHGQIKGGEEQLVNIRVTAPDEPNTDFDGYMDVISNGGDAEIYVILHVGELTPDLEVGGYINREVKPGGRITGTFSVRNAGKTNSLLDWKIKSWPDWGSDWDFDLMQGYGLTPEDPDDKVEVSFYAPNVEDGYFTGSIEVENRYDSSDYELVHISVSTPKNRGSFNLLYTVIFERFPVLQKLFESLYHNLHYKKGVLNYE
jgi:uncharacterized membrane protein